MRNRLAYLPRCKSGNRCGWLQWCCSFLLLRTCNRIALSTKWKPHWYWPTRTKRDVAPSFFGFVIGKPETEECSSSSLSYCREYDSADSFSVRPNGKIAPRFRRIGNSPVSVQQNLGKARTRGGKKNEAVSRLASCPQYAGKNVNIRPANSHLQQKGLGYLARDRTPPTTFVDDDHRRMYQKKLDTTQAKSDNKVAFLYFKQYIVETTAWAWAEPFNRTQDFRGSWLAVDDYFNGPGKLSKRVAIAKATLKSVFYKARGQVQWQ